MGRALASTLDSVACSIFLAALTLGCHAHSQGIARSPATPSTAASAGCPVLPSTIKTPSRAELDAHDLQWIGCDGGDCESGVACPLGRRALPSVASNVTYVGHVHSNKSGAFTTDSVVSENNLKWIDSAFFTYRVGERVLVQTLGDEARDQANVYFIARAFEILKSDYPEAFRVLFTATETPPKAASLQQSSWKNSIRTVLISFNTSPDYIASSFTGWDAAPTKTDSPPVPWYRNTVVLSLHAQTILGSDRGKGSRPLYGLETDDANWLAYMREGIVDTLVHEMLHRYVDYANSADPAMYTNYFQMRSNDCGNTIEEIRVASTSLSLFDKALSDRYLAYYHEVLRGNWAGLSEKCAEHADWLKDLGTETNPVSHYATPLIKLE